MKDTLVAFVFVKTDSREQKAATLLAGLSQVEELHRIAGEDCYLVRVCVTSTDELDRLVRNGIEKIKGVRATRTTLVLRTLKDLPIPNIRRSSSVRR